MEFKLLKVERRLSLFVKSVSVCENEDVEKNTILPFYADGYPGIVFQQATNGVMLRPKNKLLSELFLYGQTITPIELCIAGCFKLIVFQLYPFAARTLMSINPRRLNDDCFDLGLLANVNVNHTISKLKDGCDFSSQNKILSSFLATIIQHVGIPSDRRVQLAVSLILSSKGKISVNSLRENLHVTERTLQRQFEDQVGVSPKQFIKIIQFQTSLNQLSEEDYARLSDIAYENEYADQAHFIRTFKKFTGKTPSEFQKSL